MANTIATTDLVTNEVALYFKNSVKGVAQFNRKYSNEFAQTGGKIGQSVRVRLPQRWTVSDGQGFVQQNILDQVVNVSLTNQKHVDMGWSSSEATVDLDDIRSRYIQPAAESLANAADVLGMNAVYRDVYNTIGTLATPSATPLDYLQAGVKLDNGSTPDERRVAVLSPLQMATIASASAALFNAGPRAGENWTKGQKAGEELGFSKWFQDQNVPTFTSGTTTTATPLVNGAGQTGSSIATDGWGSGNTQLRRGDSITIGGVRGVNPLSYSDTGALQQFVVTADVVDVTGAIAALGIAPPIITSGPLQTVTASPADNAVITYWSMAAGASQVATASRQGLLFHPDAFAFVMADLVMPNGGAKASIARSEQWGISIRLVEQFNILTDQNYSRLDILIGAATIQARLASRIQG